MLIWLDGRDNTRMTPNENYGREVLELYSVGLDGYTEADRTVTAPVPWLAASLRATSAITDPKATVKGLQVAGQVPMSPPNVGGWPGGGAWLATSAVVGRQHLAVLVAAGTAPDAPARRLAARADDDDALADLLARPSGFAPATRTGLAAARRAGGPEGVAPLAVALASPDLMVA